MKELSIEEKAKAYDEAIEKLKNMMPNWERLSYNGKTFLQDLIYIFPELKESEDERIREAIYNCVEWFGCDSTFFKPVSQKECLAWLEKQGEYQKFRDSIQVGDKVTRNEDGILVNLSQLNRVAKREEPAYTQKDIDDAYLKGLEDAKSAEINKDPCIDCDQRAMNCHNFPCDRKKAFEQKPAAWSEEDEELYREALVAFASLYNEVDPVADWGKLYSWFKSLKGKIQPQPKQEWSEVDKRKIETIIGHLERQKHYQMNTTNIEQCQDWLKSLKDRV